MSPTAPPRVLWVDDEPNLLRGPAAIIQRRLGCRLDWARTVREALDRLVSEPYDLVLVDQMMPFAPAPEGDLAQVEAEAGALLITWLRDGSFAPRLLGGHELALEAWVPAHRGAVDLGNAEAPVLMVTGWEPTEEVQAALRGLVPRRGSARRFEPFIKPIDKARLQREVRDLLALPARSAG